MTAPPSEVLTTAALVDALIRAQHPHLEAEVRFVTHGWDNDIYRLGRDLSVRLPRRKAAVPALLNERRWLPSIAQTLPVAVPVAVALGQPGLGYPWAWTVTPWFAGVPADRSARQDRDGLAGELADMLVALHRKAPPDAPVNEYRGAALGLRHAAVIRFVDALEVDHAGAARIWRDACEAPAAPTRMWVHGDLHPGNVVLGQSEGIAAVIDFGDLSGGDPAVDLAAAWIFFTRAGRSVFRSRLDARGNYDPEVWRRARGWALAFALGLIHESDGSARMTSMGRESLSELLADGSEADPQKADPSVRQGGGNVDERTTSRVGIVK